MLSSFLSCLAHRGSLRRWGPPPGEHDAIEGLERGGTGVLPVTLATPGSGVGRSAGPDAGRVLPAGVSA